MNFLSSLGSLELSSRLACLVGDIGRCTFDTSLARLLVSAASIDQCNIFQIRNTKTIRCLFHWERVQPHNGTHLVERYLAGGVAVDQVLRRFSKAKHNQQSISFLRSEDIQHEWYRQFFFDGPALRGKLSIYEPGDAYSIYLNFYCAKNRTDFSALEVENLTWLSKVISFSLIRHHELSDSGKILSKQANLKAISQLLAQGAPRLTSREVEVCSRIVGGYTTEAIALDLGIAYCSVATYRKRAYAKLAISSHHQLFTLCLETAKGDNRFLAL